MHCISFSLQLYFYAFRWVLYMCNWLCARRIGLGWAHDAISFACHMFMHSHAYLLSIQYILIFFCCLGLFWLSFSPSLSSVCISLLLWHPNANLLRPKTLFILGHPLLLILHLFLSSSVMRWTKRTSLRTSLDETFIRNTKSFSRISPTLTYPLSCMDLIIQYLFLLLAFEVRALWSHQILYSMCSESQG